MFWLLNREEQERLRAIVDHLVHTLAPLTDNPQLDQLFPYVGRKDRRKAEIAIEILSQRGDTVLEPFAGSGTFVYASLNTGRSVKANEWEPYANRMSNAPWNLPSETDIENALEALAASTKEYCDYLYKIICDCGNVHVLDSMFFDREPLEYINVETHERLGSAGETITFRGRNKCPNCRKTEKFFNQTDADHLAEIAEIPITPEFTNLFESSLIENSRINLSRAFTTYKNLFPHRSIIALIKIWSNIQSLDQPEAIRLFFENAFLSVLPQAKYKDYRSKSQDLHCPPVKLREVNLWYRFIEQVKIRYKGLAGYNFPQNENPEEDLISCDDFRRFISRLEDSSVDLIFTDPPWTDGNAYFEKAQLYHPWLNYGLVNDADRLENEFVVTDAPTRRETHDLNRWWNDLDSLFEASYRVLKEQDFFAFYFRPIPASRWLGNLNKLKFYARKNGFEPILSIDVGSSDPSMRIQQSASFVFSTDIIFLFIKIPNELKRVFRNEIDIDHLVFQYSEELQETIRKPFTFREWKLFFSEKLIQNNQAALNHPREELVIRDLFTRYCDEVQPGLFLPKPVTPFSGQVFDIPAIERIFTYIPIVVNELARNNDQFTYDSFLLKIAEYVENGTRMLIEQLGSIDIKRLLEPYAESFENGRWFRKRALPTLPEGLRNIYELDPYQFEAFVARLLETQGYTDVVLAGRAGDRGIDIIANDPAGNSVVVQCKRWIDNVSATPIQRIHSFSVTRGTIRKILVTTSDFTPQALEEARNTNTELINGTALEEMIARYMPDYFG